MFVLARAVTDATPFISLVLVFLPARIPSASGINYPSAIGVSQAAGMLLGARGALLALTCVLTVALVPCVREV